MVTELGASLTRRAAALAALGDPMRLAIVDALRLADASPSELQRLLGTSSNLLAHHLKVLERHHILTRSRSEGDRRRTYLHLEGQALDGLLAQSAVREVSRVVFVCNANSARSQLGAALWRTSSSVAVSSAGLHPADRVHPGAVAAARRHGVTMSSRRPRRVSDVIHADDLVVTVCDNAHEELGGARALHWSIPDPVPSGSEEAFDAAVEELQRRVAVLAPLVHPPQSHTLGESPDD